MRDDVHFRTHFVRYLGKYYSQLFLCFWISDSYLKGLIIASGILKLKKMKTIIAFLLLCILFMMCWPLAIVLFFLFIFAWIILIPFKILGFTIEVIFKIVGGILLFPFRVIKAL